MRAHTEGKYEMGKRFAIVIGVAAAGVMALGLAAPSGAWAATTFKGTTDQGRSVTLQVGDDGLVSEATIKSRAPCPPGTGGHFGVKAVFSPLDESTPTSIADRDSNLPPSPRGFRARVKTQISGEKISDTEWTGTYKAKVRVTHHGHIFGRCNTGEIGWSATLVSG